MEKIKKIIKKSLRAWQRAEPRIKRNAKRLYNQLVEIVEDNPELARRIATDLPVILDLAFEGNFQEALSALGLLVILALWYACRHKGKNLP